METSGNLSFSGYLPKFVSSYRNRKEFESLVWSKKYLTPYWRFTNWSVRVLINTHWFVDTALESPGYVD